MGPQFMSADTPYPPLRQSWWPMVLLFVAAIIYSIDKGIVGVLAEPIRHELGVTDTQMGLLLGMAYSLLSGVLGLGLGWLVDRGTRRFVLIGGLLLWSLATLGCGLATTFGHLFVMRMLVGLGESALAPAALSLIADLFAPQQRGRALSCYFIGASFGQGLASAIPGWIVGHGLTLDIPGFGATVPWRSAFVLCGLAGPVLAALMLTIREPARHGLPADGSVAGARDKLARIWTLRAFLAPLYVAFSLFYLVFLGVSMWTAAFITRRYGLPLPAFSGALGLMLLVSGFSGYAVSGFLTDMLRRRHPSGRAMLLLILPLLAIPATLATFAPAAPVALIMLASVSFISPIINVATNAALQEAVPNDMRGFSYSLLALTAAIISGIGGPYVLALVSQHYAADPAGLGKAFMVVGIPALLVSSTLFALAGRNTAAPVSPI